MLNGGPWDPQGLHKDSTLHPTRRQELRTAPRMGFHGHLLHCHVGSIKQVVRSTLTAEGLNMILSGDEAIVIATMLHEITLGPLATREAMRLTEELGLLFGIDLNAQGLVYHVLLCVQP